MRFGTLLGSRGIASRAGLLRLAIVFAVVITAFGVWRSQTQATPSSTIAVSPPNTTLTYWNRTPFPVDVVLTNATNVAGYQFTLRWDTSLVRWVSGTLPTTWLSSTGRGPLCSILYDTTATATGTLPPPTNTPTPANPTATRTATPTPNGNITWGCGSLGTPGQVGVPFGPNVGSVPVAIGSFQFKSIADGETGTQLVLSNLGLVNPLGTPQAVSGLNGNVTLAGCHDLDGDNVVSILDLSLVADHFGSTMANPLPPGWIWNPLFDIDGDHALSILDLSIIAAGFGLTC